MPSRSPASPSGLRTLALIWVGWAALMLAFPVFVRARIDLQRPDNALTWSAEETQTDAHAAPANLLDRVLGPHVAWDSEYYLSIAQHGYDDPAVRAAAPSSTGDQPESGLLRDHPGWISTNYAFFPGYPAAIRMIAWPLARLGLAGPQAATLAGVLVSLSGALAAMLALRVLAAGPDGKNDPQSADGVRAGFYLVIWPAGFFLAQVYTEGLFLGLSFGALALMRRKRWWLAALLAAAATWTRATGALLLVPFAWTWLAEGNLKSLVHRPSWPAIARLGLVGAPAIAYLVWRLALGARFELIETHYFGRAAFAFAQSWRSWGDTWNALLHGGPQASAYQAFEFIGLGAGALASLALLRRDPALALYGLAVIAVAATSGAALGMHRYVLSAPALFLVPARLGRSLVFDRLWTLANSLAMAVLAITFAFGFWAG